jgi:hypothetical protein
MQRDIGPKPMEPFTLEEERGLVDKLDALSVESLESYIASARASLGNNALAPTWRPRIEFGARHAEQALTKAQAATARDAIALPPAPPAATVVAPKSRKAATPIADAESEQTADKG